MSGARQPSPSAPPARIARRTEGPQTERHIDILKSAAAAFRRRGYHGATVEEIAAALEMNKGNLYYYFRSKEEILYACHQYSLDILLELLDRVLASPDPPDVRLRALIVAFVHTILDELHGTALFIDLQPLTPAHLEKVIARRDRFDRGIRRVLGDGMDAGLFAPADPKLVAFAMLGAVNWIPRWFDPHGAAASEAIADAFADYLIAGLRPGARRKDFGLQSPVYGAPKGVSAPSNRTGDRRPETTRPGTVDRRP